MARQPARRANKPAEETRNKYRAVRDMRAAAYICAISKVATSYQELGIFP